MANQEHLTKIEEGVGVWNEWRTKSPKTVPDLQGAILNGADLSYADLQGAELLGADLQGADLKGANLQKAILQNANLQEADLMHANLQKAELSGANLHEAKLGKADLQEAEIWTANLQGADLKGANLQEADLRGTKLQGADLGGTNFENAYVERVQYNCETKCMGIRVGTCYGDPGFKRFARDQEYIEMIQQSRPIRYQLWLISSDCGRSIGRWFGWSTVLALLFAAIFTYMGKVGNFDTDLPFNGITEIYYSVVTFTTLGFGDVTPISIPAIILITVEVILGYIMLGGLISILATKLARRS